MENILLILICIASGFLLRRTSVFNEQSSIVLNRLIIYFFIPLITIYNVPKIEFKLSLIWLTLCPFIVFLASFIFFQFIGRVTKINTNTKAALILTSGISSTSFVGFPIFEMLYGELGLAYGIFMSLGGTILVFNTLGIFTLFYYAENDVNFSSLIKKVVTFIPFLAFVLAIIFNVFNVVYPKTIDVLLANLTKPFSVIALIAIGMQINFKIPKQIYKHLLLGQLFKLVLAPSLIYILVVYCFNIDNFIAKICILGAAIGSMNAMSILTAEKNLNPNLAMLMPGVGIPISVPILFILDYLLS